MGKPTPFVIDRSKLPSPLSARQMERELAHQAAEFNTVESVAKLLSRLPRIEREELAWIGSTKRGRRLIGKTLKRMYARVKEELDRVIDGLLSEASRKRKPVSSDKSRRKHR